ncbi:MAG TPA: SDR family NAD(P)-dependent oxidoreductase [Cyclobacteriaceae bacterium]
MYSLENKVAAIFAAYGAISSDVARSLSANGAEVYLSGRKLKSVQSLAGEINESGGKAYAYQVDATDESGIENFIKQITDQKGQLDIIFNGIGLRAGDLQYGTPSTHLPFEKFMEVLLVHLGSQFLTARTAARYMMHMQSRGTIITLSASLSRIKVPLMAGVTAACSGVEGLTRVLAAEFGQHGIKVICLNPTALAETRTIQETNALNAKTMDISPKKLKENMDNAYLMGKSPSTKDIGKFAAFLATDVGALLNSHIVDADFGTRNVI